VDIEPYFRRVGYRGGRARTRAVLDEILLAHIRAIPFENIDVALGRDIALDLGALTDKLIASRRGGYCYEHGLLMAAVLGELGFAVDLLAARVRLRSAVDDPPTPRTHLALRVRIEDEDLLLDPGFGGPGPHFAMPLVLAAEAEGPGGIFQFVEAPMGQWALQRRTDGVFSDVYHLGLEPVPAIDFEVANHFTATHPSSPFTRMLWVRMVDETGTRSLVNRELKVTGASGRQVREVQDQRELCDVLRDEFGLDVPEMARAPIRGFDQR